MPDTELETKRAELEELRSRVVELEREVAGDEHERQWPPRGYYTAYYATAGFFLGMLGAVMSLVFNIVGSLLVSTGDPQHGPLKLIQVYLTFPLGAEALKLNNGLALAIGCCLYVGTGMLFGIPFQLVVTRFAPQASLLPRLGIATVFGLVLWLVNFYGVLLWLQPLLFGGNWIVAEIPFWVAALTHLVFAWTMALVYPLGTFTPYRPRTENA